MLKKLTSKQQLKVKGPIVDANNRLNGIFNSFNPFNSKFSLGNKLIDIFSSHFSFHVFDRKYAEVKKTHLHKLDKLILYVSVNPKTTVVISDTNIKNQVAIFITHIYIHNTPVIKMIYHAINITFTKAKLFVIKCGLNQATQLTNIEYIVVIADSIHMVRKISDSSIHLYQVQMSSISKELGGFFRRYLHNSIKFWDCQSQDKWFLYNIVDKETKKFNLLLIFLYKSL